MQEKYVTREEMLKLIDKSKAKDHPYYYRFSYNRTFRHFIGARVRKAALVNVNERRVFHTVEINESSPIAKAFLKLNIIKDKLINR